MSVQAISWAMAQRAGSPSAKLLLMVMANSHTVAGSFFPSHGYLAEQTEMSRSSVKRHLAKLEEQGLIRIRNRKRASGAKTSNEYELVVPEGLYEGMVQSDPSPQVNLTHGTVQSEPSSYSRSLFSSLPAWVDLDLIDEWLQHRKELRKPVTPTAANRMIASLERAESQGHDPMELLATSIEKGWQAPYIPKTPKQENPNAAANRSGNGRSSARQTRSERLAEQCQEYLGDLGL